jgi:hypothetical protein
LPPCGQTAPTAGRIIDRRKQSIKSGLNATTIPRKLGFKGQCSHVLYSQLG